MITIQFMKPFYTKVSGAKLILVFAYQYLSIIKEGEVYHFIPIEGQEIIIDLETGRPINMSEVFVFQKGNKFIRMPLYQFFLISNAMQMIQPHIENETRSVEVKKTDNSVGEMEAEEIIIRSLIDRALEIGDKAAFMELTEQLKGVIPCATC